MPMLSMRLLDRVRTMNLDMSRNDLKHVETKARRDTWGGGIERDVSIMSLNHIH